MDADKVIPARFVTNVQHRTACPMKSERTPFFVPNNEKISLSTSTNLQPEKRDRLVQWIAHSCSLRLFPMSFHFRGRVV